jgi:hypothetical protein
MLRRPFECCCCCCCCSVAAVMADLGANDLRAVVVAMARDIGDRPCRIAGASTLWAVVSVIFFVALPVSGCRVVRMADGRRTMWRMGKLAAVRRLGPKERVNLTSARGYRWCSHGLRSSVAALKNTSLHTYGNVISGPCKCISRLL